MTSVDLIRNVAGVRLACNVTDVWEEFSSSRVLAHASGSIIN